MKSQKDLRLKSVIFRLALGVAMAKNNKIGLRAHGFSIL